MTLKKRGLGRGLDVLLNDVLVKVESRDDGGQDDSRDLPDSRQTGHGMPDRESDATGALSTRLQQEREVLLEEAEALKKLIGDLERLIRTGRQESGG